MLKKDYSNFVRPVSPLESVNNNAPLTCKYLSGDEARRIYLEEIKEAKDPIKSYISPVERNNRNRKRNLEEISDKDLLISVQNNDVNAVTRALDRYPDKINIIDEYGWSLLMIACQANSVDTVKLLLKRGIDTNVRDKAGNSARSLVIQNKNYVLANILLSNKECNKITSNNSYNKVNVKLKEEYICEICSNRFPDKEEHLSSTIHNINASKGKKIPANYVIPETNRGYQLMLKGGWDKESGLGPDGSGKKYPIKTIQKKDRKGLGCKKKKEDNLNKPIVKHKNGKIIASESQRSRRIEINFRREFY
ncbi:G patch domain and ankyrin repeat-containing protein 1 homolog [Galleria mellonella]|uniref:G patch domain and ankyrin repeat-containing protein 1 homolog n=1 Tax=Galleria mellonella TaxID=7137 RepID=A0A6J1WUI5_GALME|nr:G patch domain and ankyrin repeat-containing protein 1 homolog [Galleria mellonella]